LSSGTANRGIYPEPASSLYILKRAKRSTGAFLGDIMPLDQIRALADLIPVFDNKAHRGLTYQNSQSSCLEYHLNKYFDKDMFLALSQ